MNYPSYRSKLKIFKNIKLCIYMVESRARDLYFQIKISVQENIKINSHNRRFFKSGPLWTAMAHFGQMTVYIYVQFKNNHNRKKHFIRDVSTWGGGGNTQRKWCELVKKEKLDGQIQ